MRHVRVNFLRYIPPILGFTSKPWLRELLLGLQDHTSTFLQGSFGDNAVVCPYPPEWLSAIGDDVSKYVGPGYEKLLNFKNPAHLKFMEPYLHTFIKTMMPNHPYQVGIDRFADLRVYACINPELARMHSGYYFNLKNTQFPMPGDLEELEIIIGHHGTSCEKVNPNIIERGVHPDFFKGTCMYGLQGAYFSKRSDYCCYFSSKVSGTTLSSQFLARVICGRTVSGNSSMERPPQNTSRSYRYNSTCGPDIRVVYDVTHSLPLFRVEYKLHDPIAAHQQEYYNKLANATSFSEQTLPRT
jgi:hypothetical protein